MRGFFPREQIFQAVRTSYQRLRSMKISVHYEARGKIPARILTPTSRTTTRTTTTPDHSPHVGTGRGKGERWGVTLTGHRDPRNRNPWQDFYCKNPAKDFCWWDLGDVCLSVVVVCRAVVDGSLDLSARATSFFI
jgi:hypothetical protein